MATADVFSKRQRRFQGKVDEVYTYDKLPQVLRVQLVRIFRRVIGDGSYPPGRQLYGYVRGVLCDEYGLHRLSRRNVTQEEEILEFIEGEDSLERTLDAVELICRVIDVHVREQTRNMSGVPSIDEAFAEINTRFRESAVGYQYESGQIIRIDSQFVHSEVVKPALGLLKHIHYEGANEEFLKAHEHYRHERFKECLVECGKTFESVMKAICVKRQWNTKAGAGAQDLINTTARDTPAALCP